MTTRDAITHYFPSEGREHMRDCLRLSAQACVRFGISKLIVFTGTGEGPHFAANDLVTQEAYANLQVIAITPAVGRTYKTKPGEAESPVVRAGVSPAMRDALTELGVEIVAAHLPFKPVHVGSTYTSEWSRVSEAYGVLGGGFALCIQAVLVACDSGAASSGERVVVAAADTAFVATACRTESFLSLIEGLIVEHIVCRPMRYTVSKAHHVSLDAMWAHTVESAPSQAPVLPSPQTQGRQLSAPSEPDDSPKPPSRRR